MMTGKEIRQSFLDFFKSKQHTLVPSSSLLPDAPNLLFTNAGMNQFVPIFLGQRTPDVHAWPGVIPVKATRAADTQKCIRAGGKHNDLEDVGLDTYHHTFFEMLGNWSFGDYFKREAIQWAWELVVDRWKFPPDRLYATVYSPDKSANDPADFDQEAYDLWAALFKTAGLDPKIHIQFGGKKDNFWMMGETGPCGPCSELHVDLTPGGDTRGALVNKGSAQCIEIWNLVFIQFNANPDKTYTPLPAKHVDTGMGFERVCGIVQNTRGFTDFSHVVSNYETDIFRPIFDCIEELSGRRYRSTLPKHGGVSEGEPEKSDIAFRVIADHIRALTFAIADGIEPGNTDRQFVLRRILRRAVRYGRSLGFREPFFYKIVRVVADHAGDVFPEVPARREHIEAVIRREEEAFNKTLDVGQEMLAHEMGQANAARVLSAEVAFKLHDTYGYPLDLTELIARESGWTVDKEGFENLMEEQRERARRTQKKEIVQVSQVETDIPTSFVGYDTLSARGKVLEVLGVKDKTAVVLDTSTAYPEMGGQIGDTGQLRQGGRLWRVVNTQKAGNTWLHYVAGKDAPAVGAEIEIVVDQERRQAIQRHHTVTHLLHWALHEVVSKDATQKGSYVGPDKLTFDFSSAALTPEQVRDVEKLVNERIVENAGVSWTEVPYREVKARNDILQFFGDKYGDIVRVVQIGGRAGQLNGYSMELCGGTHTRATGEVGLFRIVGEGAIAAGVRRIEALAGLEAFQKTLADASLIASVAQKLNAPLGELDKKIDALLAQHKELEKQLKSLQGKQAAEAARALLAKARDINGTRAIIENVGHVDGDDLQIIAEALKGQFQGVVVLGGVSNGAVSLVATVSNDLTQKIQAGKIIQTIAPVVGGKGGGRPDHARGGGREAGKLNEALEKAAALF